MYTDDRGQPYSEQEIKRLANRRAAVLELMLDGQWHTNREFIEIAGTDGPRRAREFKQPWCGSLPIDERRRSKERSTKEWKLHVDKADPVWIDRILQGKVREPPKKDKGTKTCPHCNGTGKVPANYLPPPRDNEIDVLLDAEDGDEDELEDLLDSVTTDW